jgi:hypothetical protein
MTAHITMNTKANLENDHHQSNNQDRWETSWWEPIKTHNITHPKPDLNSVQRQVVSLNEPNQFLKVVHWILEKAKVII